MGNVDYFLGNLFNWLQHVDGNILVHLFQSAFTEFTAYCFSVHTVNKVTNMTPYHYGYPIGSITPIGPLYTDFPRQKQVYQSIVG